MCTDEESGWGPERSRGLSSPFAEQVAAVIASGDGEAVYWLGGNNAAFDVVSLRPGGVWEELADWSWHRTDGKVVWIGGGKWAGQIGFGHRRKDVFDPAAVDRVALVELQSLPVSFDREGERGLRMTVRVHVGRVWMVPVDVLGAHMVKAEEFKWYVPLTVLDEFERELPPPEVSVPEVRMG